MRKALLSLIILFVGSSAIGQNYQCLQSSVKHFFINSNNYLRGIRIDSTRSYADSVIFFPFHTPRGPYNSTTIPTLDLNGGSWLGKKVIQFSDGTTIFDSYWKDSVIIRTQANVGESWTFYNDSGSLYYVASVVGLDTMTLGSAIDSIKKIRINTFNASGPLPSDSLDNLTILLSKEHGFVQAFDLYTFPYHKPDSTYRQGLDFFLDLSLNDYHAVRSFAKSTIEFNLVDFLSPNDWEMHPWLIGDRFNSSNSCSIGPFGPDWKTFTSEVVSKTISGSIVTYSLTGTVSGDYSTTCYFPVQAVNAGVYSFDETQYSILSPSEMPEGLSNSGYYFYYFPFDSSYCRQSPLYIKKPLSSNPFGFAGYMTLYNYKAEVGLVGFFCSDGDEIVRSSLTYYNLNNTSCGVPLSINEAAVKLATVQITPNPATTSLTIQTTQPHNTIIINNPIGQTIKSMQTNEPNTSIDVSDIPAGIYFITVTDNNGNSRTIRESIVH